MDNIRPVVIFGDCHGRADLLQKLVDKVRERFGQEVDIYSVGDLIDRGDNSKGVIQICIDEGIKGQMGNHDQWLRQLVVEKQFNDYCQQPIMGGEATINSYGVDIYTDRKDYFTQVRSSVDIGFELYEAIPEDHKKWISSLPYYRRIEVADETYWLIHAGLINPTANAWKNKSGDPSVIYSDSEMIEMIATQNPDSILWPSPNLGRFGGPDNLYHFERGVQVFGHKPVKEPIIKDHFIALDTGCGTCLPYALSAIILPSKEIIQVSDFEVTQKMRSE
jgi:serine/threonine protein phosphatase 1